MSKMGEKKRRTVVLRSTGKIPMIRMLTATQVLTEVPQGIDLRYFHSVVMLRGKP